MRSEIPTRAPWSRKQLLALDLVLLALCVCMGVAMALGAPSPVVIAAALALGGYGMWFARAVVRGLRRPTRTAADERRVFD